MILFIEQWLLSELPLIVLTLVCTHLVVSGGQMMLHRWLGHRRIGGILFRNHINFHHAYYAHGHLATANSPDSDGNNTPFFLVPMVLVMSGVFFVLPTSLFLAMLLASTVSFSAHVYLDNAYHSQNSWVERFAWFKHKQQLHFVHHLHANSNFAVIDFFWDRLLGTYRKPG